MSEGSSSGDSSWGEQQFQKTQFGHTRFEKKSSGVTSDSIKAKLHRPGKILIILSGISIVFAVFGSLFALVSTWLASQTSDMVPIEEQNVLPQEMQIVFVGLAVMGGLILVTVYGFILVSCQKMRELKRYNQCRLAMILGMITGLSPLIFVGIPFALWAFLLLIKPNVKAAFRN